MNGSACDRLVGARRVLRRDRNAEKFGWWQTRTLNCFIRLGRDGETGRIVQWWH